MSSQPPEFEIETFERVAATPGTVLLRIAGRWISDHEERLSAPMLIIDDGERWRRFIALAGPKDSVPHAGGDAPPWSAAYPVPADVMSAHGVAFFLDAGLRPMVKLPAPAVREPDADAGAADVPDGQNRVEAAERRVTEIEGVLARAQLDARAAEEAATKELEELRARLDGEVGARLAAEATAQAQLAELVEAREEVTRTAEDSARGLVAAEAQVRELSDRADAAELRVTELAERADGAERRATELDGEVHSLAQALEQARATEAERREAAEHGSQRADEAERRAVGFEERARGAEHRAASLEREVQSLEHAVGQAQAMHAEQRQAAAQHSERAAEFDARVVEVQGRLAALQDQAADALARATRMEHQSEQAAALANALEERATRAEHRADDAVGAAREAENTAERLRAVQIQEAQAAAERVRTLEAQAQEREQALEGQARQYERALEARSHEGEQALEDQAREHERTFQAQRAERERSVAQEFWHAREDAQTAARRAGALEGEAGDLRDRLQAAEARLEAEAKRAAEALAAAARAAGQHPGEAALDADTLTGEERNPFTHLPSDDRGSDKPAPPQERRLGRLFGRSSRDSQSR